MSDDLIVWLRAQLDEDERGINEWIEVPWDGLLSSPLRAVHEITEQVGVQRMRAEVAAKRAILDSYDEDEDRVTFGHWTSCSDSCPGNVIYEVVKLLASVYADRPGYRDEWKP